MNSTINFRFGLILILLTNCSLGQQKIDLNGIYYPDYWPDETGCYLEQFNPNPCESYHFLHITGLENFLEIDSIQVSMIELNLLFRIGKMDTTISVKNPTDSITYKKNFIPEFRISPRFINTSTNELVKERSLYFCHENEPRYRVTIKFITDKKLEYHLYEYEVHDEEIKKTLIRYGEISLKKKNPKKYRNIYDECNDGHF